jgi:hypothetical protein
VSQQNNMILNGGQLRSVHSNFAADNSTATWNAGSAGILDIQADSTLLTSQANMCLNVPLSGSGNLTRTASTRSTDAQGTENLMLNGNTTGVSTARRLPW